TPRHTFPIPAETSIPRPVLPAVGTTVGHWVADDPGADLELRQYLARPGVYRLEPAVERAIEGHIAGSHQRAAPVGKRLLVLPDLPAGRRIPRHERTEVPARTGKVGTGDAH